MPMRTPFTPALPTVMWLCPVAMKVAGKSTTRRAGESAFVSLGVTVPCALISTRISSVPRTTFPRCSSFFWLAACDAGVSAAEPTSPKVSHARNTLSICFRISLLPNSRARPAWPSSNSIFAARRFPRCGAAGIVNSRRKYFLDHFPRERFAQFVLERLLEDNRVSCDSYHVAVEHRIVFMQEVGLVQAVRHHRDKAALRLHHAPHIDLTDLEAFLPRRASGCSRLLQHRTEEGIALA